MSREDRRDAAILALLLLLLLLGLALLAKLELDSRAPATPARATSTTVPTGTGTSSVHVIGGNGTPATVPLAPSAGITPEPTTVTTVTPVPALELAPAKPVWSVGLDHRCRVLDGRAFCEGGNRYGQSGNPELPVKVEQVVAGQGSTCARGEGRVFCWGYRQAGEGTSAAVPVEVQLQDADYLWNGPGGMLCTVSITSGGLNQSGKDDPGSLWCWGEGVGADGITGRDWSDVPVKIAESADWDTVAVGWRTVCALTGEVELRCWGGQPDGRHVAAGEVIAIDGAMRGIRLERLQESREGVCAVLFDRSERCYGAV